MIGLYEEFEELLEEKNAINENVMENAKKKVRYYKNVHIIWIYGQVALILQRIM